MSYQIILKPDSAAIRRSDNLHLGLGLKGGLLDSYLLRKNYLAGFGSLIGIPLTSNNLSILGVEDTTKAKQLVREKQEWIIPPFCLQNNFFRKGGPFTRIQKITRTDHTFDPENTAILSETEDYSPYILNFVPRRKLEIVTPNTDYSSLDRSDWRIKMHESKATVREPTLAERSLPLVPWTVFGLGDPDLWIEQFRCYCLGLPIPTDVKGADD